jgi:16S rRNA (uracil1498-N3)-methyltransferase
MSHEFIFYLEPGSVNGHNAHFSRRESHHLGTVLRLKAGGEVSAVDGFGNRYLVRLEDKTDGVWRGIILAIECLEKEAPLPISLALPCLKSDRWEVALEAACEIGLDEVWLTDHHCAALSWTPSRLEKAKRKAIEALKQSKGGCLTRVSGPVKLPELLKKNQSKRFYLAVAEGAALSKPVPPIMLVVGPEGGLNPDEITLLDSVSTRRFTLGKRILRSEIACVAALGQLTLALNRE